VYADSISPNPIGSAVAWLQGALLGSIAATAAVVAVASVGYLMLTGRIDMRRAVQVVFGCFILFGASSIAQGIMAGVNSRGPKQVGARDAGPPLIVTASPAVPYPVKPAQPFDPYAGAAVPAQPQ
jgi:type IV secretory pathway VirB2 component (pilin)